MLQFDERKKYSNNGHEKFNGNYDVKYAIFIMMEIVSRFLIIELFYCNKAYIKLIKLKKGIF